MPITHPAGKSQQTSQVLAPLYRVRIETLATSGVTTAQRLAVIGRTVLTAANSINMVDSISNKITNDSAQTVGGKITIGVAEEVFSFHITKPLFIMPTAIPT